MNVNISVFLFQSSLVLDDIMVLMLLEYIIIYFKKQKGMIDIGLLVFVVSFFDAW